VIWGHFGNLAIFNTQRVIKPSTERKSIVQYCTLQGTRPHNGMGTVTTVYGPYIIL